MGPLSWDLSEARTRAATGIAALDLGVVRGTPVVVVDCGDEAPTGLESLRQVPAVVIGTGEAASTHTDAFDVVTDNPAAAIDGVLANPHAAVALAQVLRVDVSIAAGLVLESFAYATLQAGPEFAEWLSAQGRRVRRPDPSPAVLVDHEADRIVLTLNRPKLRNSVSAELRDALVQALREATSAATPITLRGAGPAFSIGGDLAEFGTVSDPSTAHHLRSAANAAPWFARLADVLTVELHGATIGAGIELAAFAHHIVAAPDTTFGLPELTMGLIPGAGGTVSIPRRIGRHATMQWALENRTLQAPEALDLGLIDEIVDD